MKVIIFIFFLPLLFGCSNSNSLFVKRSTLNSEIQEIQKRQNKEIKDAVDAAISKKNEEIKHIKDNSQSAANWIYGGRLALDMFQAKDRLWTVTSNRIDLGASYLPPPSREALTEQVKTLKEELDEAKINNEELNKRYDKAKHDAEDALRVQEEKRKEAEAAVKRISKIELEWEKRFSSKQNELIYLQKINESYSEEKLAQNEWRRKQIRWIMGITGLLSISALAGCVFSPIFKKELGSLAAILGAITVILPFVTPFQVSIGLGAIFTCAIGVMVKKAVRSNRSEKAVYRAIQEHKNENPTEYRTLLAPKLENWTGKYDKNGKVIENTEIVKHIDSILMETESK